MISGVISDRLAENMGQCRTLCLKILFHGFKVYVSKPTRDKGTEEFCRVSRNIILLPKGQKQRFGENPEEGNGYVQDGENNKGSL